MKNIVSCLAMVFILGLSIATSGPAMAGNLPETPITKILNYKTGLDLTDKQVKDLNLVNNNIINKMLQIKTQAQNHKSEIDRAADNWENLGEPQIKSLVKEYYKCLADLKSLEFEAMVQASKILTAEQIRKFNEMATIELIMNGFEEDIASIY